jgi:uncharacterized protein YsxB (DUF464 family)
VSFFRVFINLFQFNRTNWKAVLLCFLAASVFWAFNALNKQYTSNIKFPLVFEYDQAKASPLEELPNSLTVNVSGNGWELLSQTLGYKLPTLVVPIEKPLEVKKIIGTTLPPMLASQVGKLQINYVVTDTLYLPFDQKDVHTYKVFVDATEISFKEGFGRTSPIVMLPDSVQLQGPKSLLHKLPDSLLVKLPATQLSSNYREKIVIDVVGEELIKRAPEQIEVMFEVNEVSVQKVKSKVEWINLARGQKVSLSSDSLLLEVQIPKSKQEEFKAITPRLILNLKRLKMGEYKIKPAPSAFPSYATILAIDSVKVKVY